MKKIVEESKRDYVLTLWKGASAGIWIFDRSLRRTAIRLYRPETTEVVYIVVIGCKQIQGPFSWENANLSIEWSGTLDIDRRCKISDTSSGFRLIGSDVEVVFGSISDPDKTFDNFLTDQMA